MGPCKKWGQAPFLYEKGQGLIGTSEMGPGPIFLILKKRLFSFTKLAILGIIINENYACWVK
jgi:hypothetical protein